VPHDGKRPSGASIQALATATGNMRGILAMIAAMASFTCGDTLMKLASDKLPTGELVFLRGAFITLMVLAALVATGAIRQMHRVFIAPIGIRAAGDVGGAFFFQSALARMPLADLMSVNQLNPMMITAASAVFLKEPIGWRRWTATIAGLCGVLLIIRPGTSAFTWWALVGFLAVLSSTVRDLATRRIDPTIPTLAVLVCSSAATTAWGLFMSLFESWSAPTLWMLAILLAASVFSMIGQLCIIIAMRSGEISVVAPFRYSLMVFAILMGFLVWGHLPDAIGFLGMAIVVGAGLYTFHREQVRRRPVSVASHDR